VLDHRTAALVVPLDERRACTGLAIGAVALTLVGVLTNTVYALSDRPPDRLQRFLDVDGEGNLPSWYSVVLMALAAVVVALVAAQRRRAEAHDVHAWHLLAAVVALMSLDEMVSLHEATGKLLDDRVDLPVLGKYAWVVPGAAATVVAARVLVRAVRGLPALTRRRLVASASVFIGGALGVEVLEALLLNDGRNYLGDGMHVLTGAQELLEMLGVILFLYALLAELRRSTAGR
jgi:hypothetical protein